MSVPFLSLTLEVLFVPKSIMNFVFLERTTGVYPRCFRRNPTVVLQGFVTKNMVVWGVWGQNSVRDRSFSLRHSIVSRTRSRY